jgi:23S rRNA pseudouridine2604 synthase
VKQLICVRIGNVQLGSLEPGEWRRLTEDEIEGLSHWVIDSMGH